MSTPSTRYYLHDHVLGKTHGPLSVFQFRALVDAGAVRPEDAACRVGDAAWGSAADFTAEASLAWPVRPPSAFAGRREATVTKGDEALAPVQVKELLADGSLDRPPPPAPTPAAIRAQRQRKTRLGEWFRAQLWFGTLLGLIAVVFGFTGLLNTFVIAGFLMIACLFALGTAWIIGTIMT